MLEGVTSTYSYDALNRVKSIGYNDGKTYTASFSYDGSGGTATGHLTSVSNYTATLNYTSFDVRGNVLASNEVTGGGTYSFTYGYNLAGALTQETYTSNRAVTTAYDSANRPYQLSGRLNGGPQTTYVGSDEFAEHDIYDELWASSLSWQHQLCVFNRLSECDQFQYQLGGNIPTRGKTDRVRSGCRSL